MTIKILEDKIEFDNGYTLTESADGNGLELNGEFNAASLRYGYFQGTVSGYSSGGTDGDPFGLNTIDKFPFSAEFITASDVGRLAEKRYHAAGQSSTTHGYTSSGDRYDKFPFAADGYATQVGYSTGGIWKAGHQSTTHGYVSGGSVPSPVSNKIEKFPFSTDSNMTNIGELDTAREGPTGQSSTTHGYTSGGVIIPTVYYFDVIEKFPFAIDADSTDVGDLYDTTSFASGQSSTTHGYTSGGQTALPTASISNKIERFPFASDSNSTQIAVLTQTKKYTAGQSSTTHGYTSGGEVSPVTEYINNIDMFSFSSDANATDAGDLSQSLNGAAGQQV